MKPIDERDLEHIESLIEQARSKLEKTEAYVPLELQAMLRETIDEIENFEEKILDYNDENEIKDGETVDDEEDDDEKEPSLEKYPGIEELFVRVEALELSVKELRYQSVKTDASPPPPNPADNP